MRRISLAMALIGAAALAGCSAGSVPDTKSGVAQGTPGTTFKINFFRPPIGGYVTATSTVAQPSNVNCGASAMTVVPGNPAAIPVVPDTYAYTYYDVADGALAKTDACSVAYGWGTLVTPAKVTLTAHAIGSNAFLGWAGDCTGTTTCVVTAGADKTVVAMFGPAGSAHPNFADSALHGPAYFNFAANPATATLKCDTCHGATLAGQGLAPSCSACHAAPPTPGNGLSKHFDAVGGLAWQQHGAPGTGWSQGCLRCHTSQGYQDYVGGSGAANNLSGSFNTDSNLTTNTNASAYAYGPLQCQTCHNAAASPSGTGITTILFPSLKTVATNKVNGLCGTCHQARESTASLNVKIAGAVTAKGLGNVTATAVTGTGFDPASSGTTGTTTTLVAKAAAFTANAYVGYTAIFNGNVTPALNGVKRTVTANDTTTLTFGVALPAAPANTFLPLTSTGDYSNYTAVLSGTPTTTEACDSTQAWTASPSTGKDQVGKSIYFATGPAAGTYAVVTANTATCVTFAAIATAAAAGDKYLLGSRSADSAVLYPTATGGSTTTLVDSNRTWTTDAFKDFMVYFRTGANAGRYAKVTTNNATTLTFAALPAAPVAGDLYVVAAPETAAVLDAQLASSSNSFTNSHYMGAAATVFGADAAGWYQYPFTVNGTGTAAAAAAYTGTNQHGVSAGKCTSCHDPHTLEVVVTASTCGRCHFKETDGSPVTNLAELEENRQFGFEGDVDGLGTPSLKTALDNNAAKLYAAIQAYATNVSGAGICYTSGSYPYFFLDNGRAGSGVPAAVANDGVCQPDEAVSANAFNKFTPRLLRAAYNYNFYMREPNAWAHNARYVTEILFDAITDLNNGLPLANKVAFTGVRSFFGHFGGAEKANKYATFRYDSGSGFPAATCYQCHGGQKGFAEYLAKQLPPLAFSQKQVTGMECTTCHAPTATDTNMKAIRGDIALVYFPPQKNPAAVPAPGQVAFASVNLPENFALCGTCHSGLENKASVDNAIGTTAATSWTLGFKNPHYLGAAGFMLGNQAHVAYEYAGKTYAGLPAFWNTTTNGNAPGPHGSPHGASCTGCHDPKGSRHTFEIDTALTVPQGQWYGAPNTLACDGCHVTAAYGDFRLAPRLANVQALGAQLLTTIQTYATAATNPVCYDDSSYPYWFKDSGYGGGTAGNGICEAGEKDRTNNAAVFNPAALKAAYNYKWFKAEPGAYAHNTEYMEQVLIDSILDLNPAAVLPNDAFCGTPLMPVCAPIARP